MTDALGSTQRDGTLGVVAGTNLAMKFGLELTSLAAFGLWGASAAPGLGSVALAGAAPAAAATVWGLFAAPRARHRLPMPGRAVLELGVFGLACAALAVNGRRTQSAVMGALVVVNAGLTTALGQWEQ